MPTAIDVGSKLGQFTRWKPYDDGTLQLPNEYGLTSPDYQKILEMLLAPLRAQEEARLAQLQAQTDAAMELARRQNDLTMGDLQDDYAQARRNIKNTLASQGLTDSGDWDFRNARALKALKHAQNQAANSLTEKLMGFANTLAAAQLASKQGLQNQALSLLPTIQDTYRPSPVFAGPAPAVNPYGPYQSGPLNLPPGWR